MTENTESFLAPMSGGLEPSTDDVAGPTGDATREALDGLGGSGIGIGIGGAALTGSAPEEPAAPAGAPRPSTGRRTTARKSTARRSGGRKTTSSRASATRSASSRGGAKKSTGRKAAAKKATGRRAATAPPAGRTGPLASSLSTLVDQLGAEIGTVNELSQTIDEHVNALNALRAEQQQRVALLLEVRAAAGDGTLGDYVDEQLADLVAPAVDEESYPWPSA